MTVHALGAQAIVSSSAIGAGYVVALFPQNLGTGHDAVSVGLEGGTHRGSWPISTEATSRCRSAGVRRLLPILRPGTSSCGMVPTLSGVAAGLEAGDPLKSLRASLAGSCCTHWPCVPGLPRGGDMEAKRLPQAGLWPLPRQQGPP